MTKDDRIASIDEEIKKLEADKKAREEKLSDPTYQEIRELWEEIADKLNRLDEMGEDVSDSEGNALTLNGKTFSIDYEGKVVEND